MATQASDIVTRAQVATALRLVGMDTAHNELLDGLISGAAEWIEKQVRLGILDTREVRGSGLWFDESGGMIVSHRASVIRDVSYWDRYDPSVGEPVLPEDLTALSGATRVAEPAGGWPRYPVVSFTRSTPPARIPGTIRAAMMLLVRDMYDAKDRIVQPSWAVRTLLQPYTDHSVGGASDTIDLATEHTAPPPTNNDTLRAGWSSEATFAAETTTFGPASSGNFVTIPDDTGDKYLVLWRSDAAGGDPISLHFGGSALESRATFGSAFDLALGGVAGKAIISIDPLKAAITSGTVVEIR